MTTTDVFKTAVTAMSAFGDVPWGGEVCSLDVRSTSVMIYLDAERHSAQALLSWLCTLTDRRMRHHHTNGLLFIVVNGTWHGIAVDVWSTFDGEDAVALCEDHDDHGPIHVHRLRMVQERQLARAVAA